MPHAGFHSTQVTPLPYSAGDIVYTGPWATLPAASNGTSYVVCAAADDTGGAPVGTIFSSISAGMSVTIDGVLTPAELGAPDCELDWTPFSATWDSAGGTSVGGVRMVSLGVDESLLGRSDMVRLKVFEGEESGLGSFLPCLIGSYKLAGSWMKEQ